MNKGMALQGIETLIQEGNNVLASKCNSDLGGTYVDSASFKDMIKILFICHGSTPIIMS